MSDPIQRPCPVCAGSKRRNVYTQRFLDGPICDQYEVVICLDCGAGFADGIPSQEKLDRYYADHTKYAYGHTGGVESIWDIKRFEATVGWLTPQLRTTSARILDIGCATGGLLSVFVRRGFSEVLGVDPSKECAAAALHLYKIKVRTATLHDLAGWTERFDLVLMVGVLEHLHNVREAVTVVRELLTADGLIYCAVPDVEGLADSHNAPFQQFSVEHLNFFSMESLSLLMGACGFQPVAKRCWSVEWREGVIEPIATGLFRRGPRETEAKDNVTGDAFKRYIEFSKKGDLRILKTINALWLSGEPILVWGTGTLTRRLLATTNLGSANIVAFVDSYRDPDKTTLANRPIWGPDRLPGRAERIVIGSIAFEREIVDTIRHKYRCSNELVLLMGPNYGKLA